MKLRMINSVDEYVAGEEYELDDATSDRFVLLGYAEGELSREIPGEEMVEIQATNQTVEA